MTYVMSDVHGQYGKYRKMLDKIGMTARDELCVLGDVVDRGPEPMAILRDMSLRINVFPILGNHDWIVRTILSVVHLDIDDKDAFAELDLGSLALLHLWIKDGGGTTFQDIQRLVPEERKMILDYLGEFEPYEELTVNGTRYVLVHAGLRNFDPDKPLADYAESDLINGRTDYSKRYFQDKILVTGHTPTLSIDPAYKGRIWRGNGHIALDCGAGFGLPLGCIRLDDGEEFYVE